jgi:drug/metabolite transporter (DMT)-like permease
VIFILAAIVFSTWLVVMFKLYERYRVDVFQGVVFNYATCWIVGLFFMEGRPQLNEIQHWDGLPWILVLGSMFISIFLILGTTAQRMGVVVASVAQKLSFVLPVLAAVWLYAEQITWNKILGSVLAGIAVILLALQKDKTAGKRESFKGWWMPVAVFFGAGMCDVIFNEIQRSYVPPGWDHFVTTSLFFVPFCIGSVILAVFYLSGKRTFAWRHVTGGVFMGIPNYFSLFFLMQALQSSGYESSALFPVVNIGIVGLSALAGIVLFRESFPLSKKLGLAFALASIVIIAFIP